MAKTEKVPKAKTRLLACIQRKTGKPYEEIAADLNEPLGTVYGWLRRIEKDGLEARYNKKQKGASCKLDAGQLGRLADDLERGPAELGYGTAMWTMPLVRRHIEEKFRTTYHVRSMSNLMHRLGFRRVVPRPRNAKSATPAEREAFKKKLVRWQKRCPRMDTRSWLRTSRTWYSSPPRRRAGSGRRGPSRLLGAQRAPSAAPP